MPKEIRSLILDYTAQNIFFAVYNIHGVDPPADEMIIVSILSLCKLISTDYHPLIFICLCTCGRHSAHCRIYHSPALHPTPTSPGAWCPWRPFSVPGGLVTCAAGPPPRGNPWPLPETSRAPQLHLSSETSQHTTRQATADTETKPAHGYRRGDPPPPRHILRHPNPANRPLRRASQSPPQITPGARGRGPTRPPRGNNKEAPAHQRERHRRTKRGAEASRERKRAGSPPPRAPRRRRPPRQWRSPPPPPLLPRRHRDPRSQRSGSTPRPSSSAACRPRPRPQRLPSPRQSPLRGPAARPTRSPPSSPPSSLSGASGGGDRRNSRPTPLPPPLRRGGRPSRRRRRRRDSWWGVRCRCSGRTWRSCRGTAARGRGCRSCSRATATTADPTGPAARRPAPCSGTAAPSTTSTSAATATTWPTTPTTRPSSSALTWPSSAASRAAAARPRATASPPQSSTAPCASSD